MSQEYPHLYRNALDLRAVRARAHPVDRVAHLVRLARRHPLTVRHLGECLQ